ASCASALLPVACEVEPLLDATRAQQFGTGEGPRAAARRGVRHCESPATAVIVPNGDILSIVLPTTARHRHRHLLGDSAPTVPPPTLAACTKDRIETQSPPDPVGISKGR